MSEEKSDGGPAFPCEETFTDENHNWHQIRHLGISLRDYFAARVMQGWVSSPGGMENWNKVAKGDGIAAMELLAFNSYEIADAMINARDLDNPTPTG